MSSVYDLTKEYSEDMRKYKERREKCMKIEGEEIVKAFNKDNIMLVFREGISDSIVAVNKNEFSGFQIDEYIHNLIAIQYVGINRIILDGPEWLVCSKHYIEYDVSDLRQTHYQSIKYYISGVLLLPSSINTIARNREGLCDRYIREIIINYISEIYRAFVIKKGEGLRWKILEHVYNNKEILAWIMLCLNDIRVDYNDILSYYNAGTSENPKIKVYDKILRNDRLEQDEQVIENFNNIMASLYNRLLESI